MPMTSSQCDVLTSAANQCEQLYRSLDRSEFRNALASIDRRLPNGQSSFEAAATVASFVNNVQATSDLLTSIASACEPLR